MPYLTELLQRARRRLLTQLVLDAGSLALLIGMAGMILLLLAGTDILSLDLPALLLARSLGVGIYRLRKIIPSLYALAQRIDKRLGLADALSTAFHFSANPEPARKAICERQRQEAEAIAGGVDLKAAVPFSRSRYLLPAV